MVKHTVKMLESEFKGERTAYSSNSIFIALLTNGGLNFNPDLIGEIIFPDGFGMVEPPGPSFGFGCLYLSESEQNGRVAIASLNDRTDEEGRQVSRTEILESLETYFDAYFEVKEDEGLIVQIPWESFRDNVSKGSGYSYIHLVEFEPDD